MRPLPAEKLRKLANKEQKYRHWDLLRHLKPPAGLTVKEWWSGLKLMRSIGRKKLPLGDFSFILPEGFLECLHLLEQTVIELSDRTLNPFHFLSEEAITSSQIEGAATTRKAAKEMLRSGRLPRNQSEQMIFNNFHVMQHLREWKDEPMSRKLLLDIHRVVTAKTLDKPGAFRTKEDHVEVVDVVTGETLHTPPPAQSLNRRIDALCRFANKETPSYFMHPIVRAIVLHFWLAYDHPFVDGNGRTARALFYWLLLKEGYWLFEYISISTIILRAPTKYAEAYLHTETDDSDLTYFLLHQLEVVKEAVLELQAYLHRKMSERLYLPEFNERQEAHI